MAIAIKQDIEVGREAEARIQHFSCLLAPEFLAGAPVALS
jgi:hypothetical protein